MSTKAWYIRSGSSNNCHEVVFADSADEARILARSALPGNVAFSDVHVTRVPALDDKYVDHSVMNWDDPNDRLALMRLGWRCSTWADDCAVCAGRDFCEIFAGDENGNERAIDWSKSVAEIDKQLYKKYNLSADEINFIETHVAPME